MMLLTDNLKDLSFERAPLRGGIKVSALISAGEMMMALDWSHWDQGRCIDICGRNDDGIRLVPLGSRPLH